MAMIAQGGTIQIQSSSYGSLGHQTHIQTVHRDSQHSVTIHPSFLHLSLAYHHLVQKRHIDHILVHFYLTIT